MKKQLLTLLLLVCLPFIGMAQDEWIGYDDGTISSSLNPTGTTNYETAILYTSADIKELGFNTISEVKVGCEAVGPPDITSTVILWQNNVEVASKAFPYADGWNTITFDSPVSIDENQDLYVGVRYETRGAMHRYAGYDASLNYSGKANLYRETGTTDWKTYNTLGDWCIQAKVNLPTRYKVTFTNVQEANMSVPYLGPCSDAVISLGTKVNAPGIYEFSVPPGEYRYIIAKEGYSSYVGTATVVDQDIEVSMFPNYLFFGMANPACPVTFNIKDDMGNAVDGAQVTFGGSKWDVGVFSGSATYGIYNYNISCFGYDAYAGTVVLIGPETIEIELTKQPFYTVTFDVEKVDVINGNSPITDAVISMGLIVNDAGDYTFSLPAGKYPYIVTPGSPLPKATGYIEVVDQDVVKYVGITPGDEAKNLGFSYEIFNANGDNLFNYGAIITFDGTTYPEGTTYIGNLTAGIYDYTVECEGYYPYADKAFIVEGSASEVVTIIMEKIPTYDVLFNLGAFVGGSPMPVLDATVSLGYIQNTQGNYAFNVPAGEYTYIIKHDSYKTATGTVNVPAESLVSKTLEAGESDKYDLTFNVKNGDGEVVAGAMVTLNGIDYIAGFYAFTDLETGLYEYTVSGDGYMTQTGKVILTEDQTVEIDMGAPVYNVTVIVNPEGAGTVTGTGQYLHGDWATLTATATTGFRFVNWTYFGMEIGNQVDVRFPVEMNMEITANFEVMKCNVTAIVNPEGAGTVEGAGEYLYGQFAMLTATANDGFTFVNWTMDGVVIDSEAFLMFVVTEDYTLTANFEVKKYNVTAIINPEEAGTVAGTGEYSHGEWATLNATANDGFTFVNWTWSGVEIGSEAFLMFPVEMDYALTANFEVTKYTVTFAVRDQNNDPLEGATVELAGVILDGYSGRTLPGTHSFSVSKDGYEPAGGSVTVTNADVTVYVNLYAMNHNVTAIINPENAGTVTGTGEYTHGEWATLTATPNEGYLFVNWTMGGMEIGSELDIRFPVESDIEVTANFEQIIHNVTAIVNPENTGTVIGTGEYPYGEWATLTAIPNEGYQFVNWTMDGTEIGNQIDVRFPVQMDMEVTANFEPAEYTVTFIVEDKEGNTIEGATIVFDGETLTSNSTTVLPGTYDYSITKDKYNPVSGTMTVTANITVRVELSPSVNISDTASSGIKLYPNPFVSHITVDDPSNTYNYITISDISGNVKLLQSLNGEKNISTENLSQGTYIIILSDKTGNQQVFKMIKK